MEKPAIYTSIIFVIAVIAVSVLALLSYNAVNIILPRPVCNCPAIIVGQQTTRGPPPCYCPVPIAQNTTTINAQNSTGERVYAPAYEFGNLSAVDPSATIGMFSCNENSDCTLVHTTSCFNNIPQQQACINRNYSSSYAAYYNAFIHSGPPMACPDFLMAGSASCACISNGCSLVYSTGGTIPN
ncbi:MAG: hypothetical protein ABSE71_04340 [Candidatus Micrarchaeaceae archaeon]|jgi:hypothetical protein